MIEVRNLVKKYENFLAVDNLSFDVPKGQILGFLGPNGAGKSTTMNMITGYISATEGTIKINGIDIFDEPEKAKKNVGYLPEIPPVYPDMTVKEYLNFVAELKGLSKKERLIAVLDAMEKTGSDGVADRLIKHISKGYKQRVGIAQAIIGNPEVIILDEPTVGLDPVQIIEIRNLMRNLAENHTVILSSHILSEISAVCDMILIINKGRLVVKDTTENLLREINSNKLKLNLVVKGEREKVYKTINEAFPNAVIEENETIGDGEGTDEKPVDKRADKVAFVLSIDECVDVDFNKEKLFYALADKKLAILEMASVKFDLEEIFLEMTEDETIHDASKEEEVYKDKENGINANQEDN